MKTGIIVRYLIIIVIVAIVWQMSRKVNPALVTLLGLMIMIGSTIWLVVSLVRRPKKYRKKVKSWWKLFWDGFWGLG